MPAIVSPRKTSSDSSRCDRLIFSASASADAPCVLIALSLVVAIPPHPARSYISGIDESRKSSDLPNNLFGFSTAKSGCASRFHFMGGQLLEGQKQVRCT